MMKYLAFCLFSIPFFAFAQQQQLMYNRNYNNVVNNPVQQSSADAHMRENRGNVNVQITGELHANESNEVEKNDFDPQLIIELNEDNNAVYAQEQANPASQAAMSGNIMRQEQNKAPISVGVREEINLKPEKEEKVRNNDGPSFGGGFSFNSNFRGGGSGDSGSAEKHEHHKDAHYASNHKMGFFARLFHKKPKTKSGNYACCFS